MLFKMAPFDISGYFLTRMFTAAVPSLTAYFFAKLIDQIISYASGTDTLESLSLSSDLSRYLLLFLVCAICSTVLNRTNSLFNNRIANYHLKVKELELFSKVAQLDIQQFEDPDISNQIQKAQDNTWKIREFMRSSASLAEDLTGTIVTGIIFFKLSPILLLITILLAIPNSVFFTSFIREWWDFYNGSIESFKRSGWLKSSLTREKNMPEHKISSSHTYLSNLMTSISTALFKKDIGIYTGFYKKSLLGNVIEFIAYLASLLFLIIQFVGKFITIGQFTFYESQITKFSGNLDSLLGTALDLLDMGTYIGFIRKVFELKPAIKSGSVKLLPPIPPLIEFKNVSFKYPRSQRYALKDINITMEPKKNIAIVGENGAGKSTLIKLLLRFYDPTSGKILINGKPLSQLDLKDYYKYLSALFQDFNGYGELDIKTNIGIGKPDDPFDVELIAEAAKKADADRFINDLEKKYDQTLNKQFSGGTNLSTGQWQKLALARMFYRDTPVLILDEPTASIDAEAEYKIFKRIYSFIKEKTVVIISHRFSTVRNADIVHVLDQGSVIESGSHTELMKQNGKYAKAFNLQAEGYNATE